MKSFITIVLVLVNIALYAKEPESNHKLFLNKVFQLLETHVANPAWLEDETYQSFKIQMYSKETLSLDDKDFYKTFNRERKILPFTHFYLKQKKTGSKNQHELTWKLLNKKTAYLDVRSFSSDPKKMITSIQEIGTDAYSNLIIDLRDNGGGTLDAAVILGQFLTNKPIDAGVYLTQKWYVKESRNASVKDIAGFPYLTDFTYQGIMKMFLEQPAFRMVVPGHQRPVYKGKVFVLINENTASTCEPLLYLFKKEKIATLVGTTSAGAMLSGNTFKVDENYNVFIPIADYQTHDGIRLDKVGVQPDVVTASDRALDYVINRINEQ